MRPRRSAGLHGAHEVAARRRPAASGSSAVRTALGFAKDCAVSAAHSHFGLILTLSKAHLLPVTNPSHHL